jgi:hypothetical protein
MRGVTPSLPYMFYGAVLIYYRDFVSFYYNLNSVTCFSPCPRNHSTTSPTFSLCGRSKQQLVGAVRESVPYRVVRKEYRRRVALMCGLVRMSPRLAV